MTSLPRDDMYLPDALEWRRPAELRPYERNARTHSRKQLRLIADSIERFGFTNPVLIGDDDQIIAGHGRVEAAKILGLVRVPVLRLSHLSEIERRAYILADNKLAERAGWDDEILAIELQALVDLDFDIDLTGFEITEVDALFDRMKDGSDSADAYDDIPPAVDRVPVTRPGDLWQLGAHRLLCGDSRDPAVICRLMDGQKADLIFTDPPYNVPIDGHVTGKGRHRHGEFAFASGEMTSDDFTRFLSATLGHAAGVCRDGAIAFVCMDWRHMEEILIAGKHAFTELKNLCVWNKSNAGMGSFYRSKHELVFVFKIGKGRHTNSFGLGETGRYRSNVWDYAGVNIPTAESQEALAMHPTVKPVALVEDAIRDCSRRGENVLDVFGGSGSTLIAEERCGRHAYLVEFELAYCDTILARYQRLTGDSPVRAADGALWASLHNQSPAEAG